MTAAPNHKSRPCRFCRCWFTPAKFRVGIQYACSKPKCQRERHAANCADLRRGEGVQVRAERLKRRLTDVPPNAAATMHKRETLPAADPSPPPVLPAWNDVASQLRLARLRDVVGEQATVVIEVIYEVVRDLARDLAFAKPVMNKDESSRHARQVARDAISRARSTA